MRRLITLRCKMQDNGFRRAAGRALRLAECREKFRCNEDGPHCANCTLLEIQIPKQKRAA